MPTSLNKYLDPAGLDENVINIRRIAEGLEAEMQDLPYARPDGLYPDMTVGAVIGADETAQWTQRESTGNGSAIVRSVQGAAVAWNQLYNKSSASATINGVVFTGNADGTWTVSGTASGLAYKQLGATMSIISGHKYLLKGCPLTEDAACRLNVSNSQATGNATDSGEGKIFTGLADGMCAMGLNVFDGKTVNNLTFYPQLFDLTQMFGSGNEPTTVAEFERMYPEAYYPYSAPTLKPVQIAGIRSVGFNQWDEEWEAGGISSGTGEDATGNNRIRSKNYIPVFPSALYYVKFPAGFGLYPRFYDGSKNYVGTGGYGAIESSQTITVPSNANYLRFWVYKSGWTPLYNHDICINISNPALNGTYKPYTTDSVEWTAQTLRAAGSVRDELTADELVTRVGVRTYQSGDESDTTVRTDGTTTFYPLATPTTMPISPALPMTYRIEHGGTEYIIVPAGEVSAAPVLTVAEPVNAGDEFARIWEAIQSLGYTRNAAQLSRPVSLTDIGSIDEVQKDTAEIAEIDTTKEVQE